MRYAIDRKPIYYKPIRLDENDELLDVAAYVTEAYDGSDNNTIEVDWRELIYQMGVDYYKYNHKLTNFTQLIAERNSDYYPNGITGYETYYTDLQGFWR
jgi:hypothetical protein